MEMQISHNNSSFESPATFENVDRYENIGAGHENVTLEFADSTFIEFDGPAIISEATGELTVGVQKEGKYEQVTKIESTGLGARILHFADDSTEEIEAGQIEWVSGSA